MKRILLKVLKTFKMPVYAIEKNSFVGDYVDKITSYEIQNDIIKSSKIYLLKDIYLFEFQAKKEIKKNSLKYDPENIQLVKKLIKSGIVLTNYANIQLLEDGKNSEVYQNISNKFKI